MHVPAWCRGWGGILEREHELDRLASAAREAADGAGSVVLVHGEAGIGKSSLVKAVERPLVDALLPDGVAEPAVAEQRGLLTVTPERAGFRLR
ncbi:ATP-binding protein [Streptomyces sp. NPDC102365]|uniref:ATP-binding protein n=1 Tax=Streptomyces sp. NPDC102365 TaxID=3366162 RepID=UPI0037F73988